jgi:hypothetical protein
MVVQVIYMPTEMELSRSMPILLALEISQTEGAFPSDSGEKKICRKKTRTE